MKIELMRTSSSYHGNFIVFINNKLTMRISKEKSLLLYGKIIVKLAEQNKYIKINTLTK